MVKPSDGVGVSPLEGLWELEPSLVHEASRSREAVRNARMSLKCFMMIKIRGFLFIAEVLDYRHYKQECPRIYRERYAFLCSEVKLSRFQQYMKSKNANMSMCYLIRGLLCWLILC